jgi:hypothetical protein
VEEYLWSAEGHFSFTDLLCQLLVTDAAERGTIEPKIESYIRDSLFVSAKIAKRLRMDSIPIVGGLPTEMSAKTDGNIFHERVHYWQYVANPLFHERFFLELEKIAIGIAEAGGNRYSMLASQPTLDAQRVRHFGTLAEANFTWFDLSEAKIVGFNEISFPLPTAQCCYLRPTLAGPAPGFGAILEVADGGVALVPFTATALAESAAMVAECLYADRPVPRLEKATPRDVRYLGCWEYWNRLHSTRALDDLSLATSFLAAVDLAFLGGHPGPEEQDEEYLRELRCIPYRFGKLAFRSQGVEFPSLEAEGLGAEIQEYQDRLAAYSGWPGVRQTCAKAAVELTRGMVAGILAPDFIPRPQLRCLSESDDVLAANPRASLGELWSAMRVLPTDVPRRIGFYPLGMMLNAVVYRLEHPGHFAAPNFFSSDISRAFPLPLFLLEGIYRSDDNLESRDSMLERPHYVNSTAVAQDALQIIPLGPLAEGSDRCGFYDAALSRPLCLYGRHGLGCPQAGLSPEESALRKENEIDDWCHWTFIRRKLGLKV